MAIYKPPKARWPLAVFAGALGLLLGIALGFALGQEDPDAAEGVRLVQQELAAAAAGLEVAGIEYTEAVANGQVVSDAEYEGSLSALESSRSRYEEVGEALETLAPERAAEIAAGYNEVQTAMEGTVLPEEVDSLIEDLTALLQGDG
jgi:hypothetical protein